MIGPCLVTTRAGSPSRGDGTHYSGGGHVAAAEALLDEPAPLLSRA